MQSVTPEAATNMFSSAPSRFARQAPDSSPGGSDIFAGLVNSNTAAEANNTLPLKTQPHAERAWLIGKLNPIALPKLQRKTSEPGTVAKLLGNLGRAPKDPLAVASGHDHHHVGRARSERLEGERLTGFEVLVVEPCCQAIDVGHR